MSYFIGLDASVGGDGSVLFDTRGKNDEVQYGCNTCDKEAWFFGGRNPTST